MVYKWIETQHQKFDDRQIESPRRTNVNLLYVHKRIGSMQQIVDQYRREFNSIWHWHKWNGRTDSEVRRIDDKSDRETERFLLIETETIARTYYYKIKVSQGALRLALFQTIWTRDVSPLLGNNSIVSIIFASFDVSE